MNESGAEQPAALPEHAVNEAMPSSHNFSRFALSFTCASAGAAALITAFSAFIGWAASRGQFFNDLVYHLLMNVLRIPPEQAAFFAGRMKPDFWLHLMLLHGGTIEGTYRIAQHQSDPQSLSFSLHIPLIFSVAIWFVILFLCGLLMRPLVKRYAGGQLLRFGWAAGFSAVYSIVMTIILLLARPDSEFVFGRDEYTLELSMPVLKSFLLIFLLCLAAVAVGLGKWAFLSNRIWGAWAASIRTFVLTIIGFFILIGSLMAVSWTLSNQSHVYSTQITTMGSIWKAYKTDPAVYAVVPNVLLQEQIYSLGGTWHISGQPAADLLEVRAPLRLSLFHSVRDPAPAHDSGEFTYESAGEPSEGAWKQELADDIRWQWYHVAFLLAYLFALSRIQLTSVWIYAATVSGVIILASLLSVYFNISFTVGQSPGAFIGFEWSQAVLAVGLTTVVFLTLSYAVQLILVKRRAAE
ncbi:hypothetical protein [Paenibacillus abyssi]|nr:hypothetical protein [Paenibacillus abyssi]